LPADTAHCKSQLTAFPDIGKPKHHFFQGLENFAVIFPSRGKSDYFAPTQRRFFSQRSSRR
jgi:hypothetical protein